MGSSMIKKLRETKISVEKVKEYFDKELSKLVEKEYITSENEEDIKNFLEVMEFYKKPSSIKFHGNFTGGLAIHTFYVHMIYKARLEDYGIEDTTGISLLAPLFHDLCKTDDYIWTTNFRNARLPDDSGWDNSPGWVKNKNCVPIHHSVKSIMYAHRLFPNIDSITEMSILYHMGPYKNFDDGSTLIANHAYDIPEVLLLHHADIESCRLFEEDPSRMKKEDMLF
jgi:hypothetical protein